MIPTRVLSAAALALCAPASAQPALKHLSGDIVLHSPYDLTHPGNAPFDATLYSRTGAVCRISGTVIIHAGALREVEAVTGKTFVHCPGTPPALVVGHFAPARWAPPQVSRCSARGARGMCLSYSTTVEAGASGSWLTWHALTSEQTGQPRARHD